MGGQDGRSAETSLIGRLQGFIETVAPDIRAVKPHPSARPFLEPDLLLARNDELLVVEIKLGTVNQGKIQTGSYQLFSYLTALNIDEGVLFLTPGSSCELQMLTTEVGSGSVTRRIYAQSPSELMSD